MAAAAASTEPKLQWRPKPPPPQYPPAAAVVEALPQRPNLYDQRLDAVIACGRQWLESAQKAKEEMGSWKSSLQVSLGSIGATSDKEAVVGEHYRKYQKFEKMIQTLGRAAERLLMVEELSTRPPVDPTTWTLLDGIGALPPGSYWKGAEEVQKGIQKKIGEARELREAITGVTQTLAESLSFQRANLSNLSHKVAKGREPLTNQLTRNHTHFHADYTKYCSAVATEEEIEEKEPSWEEIPGNLLEVTKAPYFVKVAKLKEVSKPTLDKNDAFVAEAGALIVKMQGKVEEPLKKEEVVKLWEDFRKLSAHRVILTDVVLPQYNNLIRELSITPDETSLETFSQMGVTIASVQKCEERIEEMRRERELLIEERTRFIAVIGTLEENISTLRSLLFKIAYFHKYGKTPWSFPLAFMNQTLDLEGDLREMSQGGASNEDDDKGDGASRAPASYAEAAAAGNAAGGPPAESQSNQ